MSGDFERGDLQSFLHKALEIQLEDTGSGLSQEDLKGIALRAGLTEEDWNRICSTLDAHLNRGRNFLEFKNAVDAVSELDQAAILAPYRADVLADCGKAHQLNWEENREAPSKTRAVELFERCLRIEPNHVEAAQGLSELKSPSRSGRKERPHQSPGLKKKVIASASVAAVLMLGSAVFAWKGLTASSGKSEPEGNATSIEQVASQPEFNTAEFADWLQTKRFSFSGVSDVEMIFEADYVQWESKGKIGKFAYTVGSSGRLKIDREEGYEMQISSDLRKGQFESSRGTYHVAIQPRN